MLGGIKMRYVIAVDTDNKDKQIFFRKTLCVIHREECGEVHYHTKPIKILPNKIKNILIKGLQKADFFKCLNIR